MRPMRRVLLLAAASVALAAPAPRAPHPKLQADADIDARWIYDDVPRALAQAKESGKPLLLVFR